VFCCAKHQFIGYFQSAYSRCRPVQGHIDKTDGSQKHIQNHNQHIPERPVNFRYRISSKTGYIIKKEWSGSGICLALSRRFALRAWLSVHKHRRALRLPQPKGLGSNHHHVCSLLTEVQRTEANATARRALWRVSQGQRPKRRLSATNMPITTTIATR